MTRNRFVIEVGDTQALKAAINRLRAIDSRVRRLPRHPRRRRIASPVAGVDTLEAAPELAAMLAVSRLVAAGGPLEALLDRVAAEAAGVVGRPLGQHPAARRRHVVPARGRVRPEPDLRRAAGPRARARARPGPVRPGGAARPSDRDRGHRAGVGVRARGATVARDRGLPRDGLGPADLRRGDHRRAERLPAAVPARGRRASWRCWASSASTPRARSDRAADRAPDPPGRRAARGSCAACASRPTSTPTGCTRCAGCSRSARRRTRCASSSSSRPPTTSPTAGSPARSSTTSSPGCCWPRPRSPSSAASRCEIDDASRLERLPRRLADADAVTIVGNLLENAFDAVAAPGTGAPPRAAGDRRRRRDADDPGL